MTRYEIVFSWPNALEGESTVTRTVDFNGESIVAATNINGDPSILGSAYREAIEGLLKTHEDSGYAGVSFKVAVKALR